MNMGQKTRIALLAALVLPMLQACDREAKKMERANKLAADSMAEARKRGETDLTNPEMGSKVLITLTEWKVAQSHTEIPKGQVTFVVENKGQKIHEFEVLGPNGRWKTMPISPGGNVLLSMILEGGTYDLFSPSKDSTGTDKDKGMAAKILAK